MVNLDLSNIEMITPQHLRILQSVEQGMRNHEYVPIKLIIQISKMSSTELYLKDLLRLKLISRYNKTNYGLTYLGYDYLALTVLKKRNLFSIIGTRIGVGKEADVYIALQSDEQLTNNQNNYLKEYAIKFHKLGLSSFKTAKYKRQYLNGRNNVSWMYLGRLSALREFGFMVSLYKHGYPCPEPISLNRHCVVMSFESGIKMAMLKNLTQGQAQLLGWEVWKMHVDLLKFGVVHGDFNEYNLIIRIKEEFIGQDFQDEQQIKEEQCEEQSGDQWQSQSQNYQNQPLQEWPIISKFNCNIPQNQFYSKIIVIDFPQMISISDPEAEEQFDRDIYSYENFLNRRFDAQLIFPRFAQIIELVRSEMSQIDEQAEQNELDDELKQKNNDPDNVISMNRENPPKQTTPYLIQASETFVRNQVKLFEENQAEIQDQNDENSSNDLHDKNDLHTELTKLCITKKARDVKGRIRAEGNKQSQKRSRTDVKGTGRNKADWTKKEY